MRNIKKEAVTISITVLILVFLASLFSFLLFSAHFVTAQNENSKRVIVFEKNQQISKALNSGAKINHPGFPIERRFKTLNAFTAILTDGRAEQKPGL